MGGCRIPGLPDIRHGVSGRPSATDDNRRGSRTHATSGGRRAADGGASDTSEHVHTADASGHTNTRDSGATYARAANARAHTRTDSSARRGRDRDARGAAPDA